MAMQSVLLVVTLNGLKIVSWARRSHNRAFSVKQNKKVCSGAVLMAGAYRIWKLAKTNFLRAEGRKIWRGPAFDVVPIFARSFELRAVDRNVFYHLLPGLAPTGSSTLITSSPPLPPSKPPRSGLRIFFFRSCVMSIYYSYTATCLCRLACCCYTSSRHIIT